MISFPDVPKEWKRRQAGTPLPVVSTVLLAKGIDLHFFSTLTTFVGASDVMTDELRIEAMHPADETTRRFCRLLAKH